MTEAAPSKAPWHLWAVGVFAVLWNGFGAFDYTMTNVVGEEYLRAAGMNDAQIAELDAMPAYMTAVWAIGVWGGLAGAVLLLMRRKWALPVFIASCAAFVMSLVYYYVLSNASALMGESMAIMNAIILAGCLFFIWYAWFAAKRGLLR